MLFIVINNNIGGYFMSLPKDSMILLSYVNTKLRDVYPSLDELCAAESADPAAIMKKLADVGYSYSKELNKFI